MSKKKYVCEYGLDYGQMIYQDILANDNLTFGQVSKRLGISITGFKNRLKRPNYGNIYDLIKISLILKKDYFEPAHQIIKKAGAKLTDVYTNHEVDILKKELAKLKKSHDRLEKIIDRNLL